MEIKTQNADRFLKSPPEDLVGALFYGPDTGLVSERAGELARRLAADPKQPGEIIRIDDNDLADDPDRMVIELRTIPMFGGRKIVRSRIEQRLRPEALASLFDGTPLSGVLIAEAGNLKGDSKLRELFSKAANLAAVACYEDDNRTLAGVITETLQPHRISIGSEARQHLVELLGADRSLSRNELEKLVLYVGAGNEVTIEAIDAIVGDAAGLQLDEIAMAATAGRSGPALADFDRALAGGESVQSLLLALQRHVLRLHQVRAAVDSGAAVEQAVRSMRPPLHFKVIEPFTAQLRAWTLVDLQKVVGDAQSAIAASRRMPLLERELAERLILDIASAAGGRRVA